jgi:hypothetical protein
MIAQILGKVSHPTSYQIIGRVIHQNEANGRPKQGAIKLTKPFKGTRDFNLLSFS